ncbi:MAG: hypothetical protein ACN4E2_02690 [Nitrospinota bacterium]
MLDDQLDGGQKVYSATEVRLTKPTITELRNTLLQALFKVTINQKIIL